MSRKIAENLFQTFGMFRRNVVALIFNEKKEFLACHRLDRKGWQCVQGGVEDDDQLAMVTVDRETGIAVVAGEDDQSVVVQELPLPAAWRELDEEVGLAPEHGVEFVGWLRPPTREAFQYCFPRFAAKRLREQGYVGQVQTVLVFYAPSTALEHICLLPPQLRPGKAGSLPPNDVPIDAMPKQEFRSCAWMEAELFAKKSPGVKQHIFKYMLQSDNIQAMQDIFLSRRFDETKARPASTQETPPCAASIKND